MSEGVAYDSRKKILYLGSIYKRKMIAVTADGNVIDFTKSKQDGLLGVIGMEVDEKKDTCGYAAVGPAGMIFPALNEGKPKDKLQFINTIWNPVN